MDLARWMKLSAGFTARRTGKWSIPTTRSQALSRQSACGRGTDERARRPRPWADLLVRNFIGEGLSAIPRGGFLIADKRKPRYRNQDRAHKRKSCVDCTAEGITTARKAPYPGPRCATHNRAKKAQRKSLTQEQRWMKVYGISAEEYLAIYEYQDSRCYICRRATGANKKLSVDHCHETGVVRGLLCLPCNRNVLGHARDDIEFFERAIDYLNSPPAVMAIGVRVVPKEG